MQIKRVKTTKKIVERKKYLEIKITSKLNFYNNNTYRNFFQYI